MLKRHLSYWCAYILIFSTPHTVCTKHFTTQFTSVRCACLTACKIEGHGSEAQLTGKSLRAQTWSTQVCKRRYSEVRKIDFTYHCVLECVTQKILMQSGAVVWALQVVALKHETTTDSWHLLFGFTSSPKTTMADKNDETQSEHVRVTDVLSRTICIFMTFCHLFLQTGMQLKTYIPLSSRYD